MLPFHGENNEISVSMKVMNRISPLDYASQKHKAVLFGAETLEQGNTIFCKSPELRQFIEACLTWDYFNRPASLDLL